MKHVGPISGVAAHGGKLVATAGYDNQVILWSADDHVPIGRVFHDHLANQCAFSPDGDFLATASSDYTARIWAVPNMRLVSVLNGHDDDVEMATFSPNGQRIATCSRDHQIRIFDQSGYLDRVICGHRADVISVTWSANGRSLISSSDDGTVRKWDPDNGQEVKNFDLGGVETDTVVVTEDGWIYAGDDEGRITLFRDEEVFEFPAHNAGIKRLVFNAAHKRLASFSYDRTLNVWGINHDGRLSRIHECEFLSIVWPRAGAFLTRDKLVFGSFGSSFVGYDIINQSWDTQGIEPDCSINAVTYGENNCIYTVGDSGTVFSDGKSVKELGSLCNFLLPFGKSILTGGQLGILFDAKSGDTIHQHRSPLNCGARFQKNGENWAIVGTYTGEGLVFRLDPAGKPVLAHTIKLHDNAVKGIATNGKLIFSVCATGAAATHRIEDLKLSWHNDKAHERIANGCATLGENGFASVSRDLKLRLWRGEHAEIIDTPHQNSIKCIDVSFDGRFVATGSYNGTVAIYDVDDRRWTNVSRPTAAGISSLAAQPGTTVFAASSYDGEVHIVPKGSSECHHA